MWIHFVIKVSCWFSLKPIERAYVKPFFFEPPSFPEINFVEVIVVGAPFLPEKS
jgi:hypothetical protein